LQETADVLMVVDRIIPVDFIKICAKHGLEIGEPVSSEDTIYWGYDKEYRAYKEKQQKES